MFDSIWVWPSCSSAPAPAADEPCLTGQLSGQLSGLLAEVTSRLVAAAGVPVGSVDDAGLAAAIGGLAGIESRVQALRMDLAAEAERRRVAESTAETGTDAWLARLTGSTREQARGGLWLAGLLQNKYPATREGFAAGALRVEQVRVIVNAAEQSPAEATPAQVAAAEQWLVDQATGAGTRSGRGLDAKGLRQAARRMFARLDPALAERHQAILLGRETRTAQAETYLALHDNGDGSFSGRFRIPELHGHLLTQARDRLTSPRRLGRDKAGNPVTDQTAPGTGNGANIYQTSGAALCELIEHLPTRGWPGGGGNGCVAGGPMCSTSLGSAAVRDRQTPGPLRSVSGTNRLIKHPPGLPGTDRRGTAGTRGRREGSAWRRKNPRPCRAQSATRRTQPPLGSAEPRPTDTTGNQQSLHHRIPWAQGGPTDLDNGLPLCGHHHRRAHDTRFDLRQRPDVEWAFHRRT